MKNWLASLALLSACGGTFTSSPDGASPAPAPSASPDAAQPLVPTLLETSPTDGSTVASFTGDITLTFSTDMDATSTIAAVTVAPSVSCTGSVSGATYTCAHAALSPSTQYTVIVHATATSAGGLPLDGEHSFSFSTGQASVTKVAVTGSPANEVRQGSGPTTITLTGNGLSNVTTATLGTLPATIGAATDTTLALTVMVPHGIKPGALDLVLVTSGGHVTVPSAVVVTAISAAADVGDDTAAGTKSAPFATLRHALGIASTGDTVALADGTYSTGETWPAALPATFVNVPDGVHVAGTSIAGTILTPAAGSPAGLDGLVFDGTSGASDLTIHGFQRGIIVVGGSVDLERVHVYGNTLDGIYAQNDAYFDTSASEIDTNGGAGVSGTDTSVVDLLSTYVHGNHTGAYMAASSYLSAEDGTRFDANGSSSEKTSSGVFLTGAATLSFEASAEMNLAAGVYSESSGSVQIEGGNNNNGKAGGCLDSALGSGIVIAGAGDAELSGEASGNACAGVAVIGPPTIVTMTGMRLQSNAYMNAWIRGTGTLLSQVSIYSSQLSDAPVGIVYGNFVALTVQSTSITGDTSYDLESQVTQPDSSNLFTNCTFGSDAAPKLYPAKMGTLDLSSSIGSALNGPSWSVESGSVMGAPFVLRNE